MLLTGLIFTFLRFIYMDKLKQESEFYMKGEVMMATSMAAFNMPGEDDQESEDEEKGARQTDTNAPTQYD